ncbi:hypothetical protein FKM82_016876 [Ascaphus truei]
MFFFGLIYLLILHSSESKELVGPKQVTGIMDGSITIKCFYSTVTKANKYDRKFLCREAGPRRKCGTVVSSNNYVMEDFRNRASLVDNPAEGVFIMELSGLKLNDEGTYRCGIGTVNNGLTVVVNVAVTEDSTFPKEAELVYGQLRSAVTLLCDFGVQYSTRRKYLCKLGRSGCRNVIDSMGEVATEHQGRIILSSEKQPGSFTVKLIQLRKEDYGLYACGVGQYGEDGDSKVYDLRINEETDIPQGSKVLTGSLGGSLSAQCYYDPKRNYTLKYWCKWGGQSCSPLIQTSGFVQDSFEGRITIHDDPANGTLQILMNQLVQEDEGWYWCAVTDGSNDQMSTVQVKVTDEHNGGLARSRMVIVPAGKPARIPCSYPCKYKTYQKYWCKWSNFGCSPVTSQEGEQNGLTVNCEPEAQQLVLHIDAVTSKDEGWYWCGVRKSERYGETLAVHLKVEEEGHVRDILEPDNAAVDPAADKKKSRMDSPPHSSEDPKSSNVLAISLSICAAVLLVSAVFLIIKLRRRKNSELVSVGSYRTNISLTDLDNSLYIGKDNPVKDAQETEISSSQEEPKTNKKGSKEDLTYSTFLIYSDGKPNDDIAS